MSYTGAPSLPYSKLGIVEDGDTASRAISKDAYVIWKGNNYFAKTDILQGATFVVDTNLTAIPDGVVNGLIASVIWKKLVDFQNPGTTNHAYVLPEGCKEIRIVAEAVYNSYHYIYQTDILAESLTNDAAIINLGGGYVNWGGVYASLFSVSMSNSSIMVNDGFVNNNDVRLSMTLSLWYK